MTLTQRQLQDLVDLLGDDEETLTAWEEGFIESNIARRNGRALPLTEQPSRTPTQDSKLEELWEKHCDEDVYRAPGQQYRS